MDLLQLLTKRRTIRKFQQKPLTEEQLRQYVEAARLAPSAANIQPLKYICISSETMVKKLFPMVKWAGYLAPEYNPKPGEEPVGYIAVCIDTSIKQSGCEMDIGAAVENIILAAASQGVGTCWMGAIDKKGISDLLELPQHIQLSCVIALGYPLESPKEVAMVNDDIKYFVDNESTLCVSKRSLNDVLLKSV